MKKIIIFQLIFFLSIPLSIFSQIIKIIDKSDLQPVSNASITNKSKTFIAYTDNKGKLDVSTFPKSDSLYITHIAFQNEAYSFSELEKSAFVIKLVDNAVKLDEVVLSANKVQQAKSNIPNKVEIITSKQISFGNPQTSADMLANTGSIYVQQSQMGGGSPILRGLEANRVLLVIDGVRMNNAIYRSEHLQNIITIDPNIIDKTEVLFGPGSVIYGSDALGGVIHIYTKNPSLSNNDRLYFRGSLFSRYSSANSEKSGGVTLNFGKKKWGSLTSFAYKELDDLREGGNRNPFYGDWGKCLYYTERINGKDSVMQNSKPNLQKNTGYSQYDILQKVLFAPNAQSTYILNLQFSNSSDIPRYDRLTQKEGSSDKFKYAEWYYGPQTRGLASIKASYKKDKGFFNTADITGAYQYISEDRVQRKFGKNSREHREETVNVASLNVDLSKKITEKNELFYGAEAFYNHVASVAYSENILNGKMLYNISSRYPDNGSNMITTAAFLAHNWKLRNNLFFSQGLRYSSITLRSEYTDTMMAIMKFPFDKKIKQQNGALNGSIGLTWNPGFGWNISLCGTSGFRTPNVDDLTKVNDSKSTDKLIIVPNPDLKPEYAYNGELTVGKVFQKSILVEGTVFYTLLKDAIGTKPFQFNGQDSIFYDGTLCEVRANINYGEAEIYGVQADLKAQVTPAFSINSNITYTYGRLKKSDVPFSNIPPVFGLTSFKLAINKFKSEFYIRYSGWKNSDDYSTIGDDNIGHATIYGLPAWFTLNLKTGYQINRFVNIQAGLENILDIHYRMFASGISAPGRNLVLTLRGNL
ncbi:MAG: TonB-dependent receptor [Bacteroidetes bacterium]|nr:TonB-dependent receptor [Bacteroidota bacterium]